MNHDVLAEAGPEFRVRKESDNAQDAVNVSNLMISIIREADSIPAARLEPKAVFDVMLRQQEVRPLC